MGILTINQRREKAGQAPEDISPACSALLYHRLMKRYLASGRKGEAMAVYERCRKALHSVFWTEPSPDTKAVYRSIDK